MIGVDTAESSPGKGSKNMDHLKDPARHKQRALQQAAEQWYRRVRQRIACFAAMRAAVRLLYLSAVQPALVTDKYPLRTIPKPVVSRERKPNLGWRAG